MSRDWTYILTENIIKKSLATARMFRRVGNYTNIYDVIIIACCICFCQYVKSKKQKIGLFEILMQKDSANCQSNTANKWFL